MVCFVARFVFVVPTIKVHIEHNDGAGTQANQNESANIFKDV
jgi:hypothetical protein